MSGLLVVCCFLLRLAGVFGADVTMTVMKGDNVTLLINPEEIKRADDLLWKFEDTYIATIDLEEENRQAKYPDDRFRGRLNLERNTGSLTISNIRTEDIGEYKMEIRSSWKTKYKTFNVTVNAFTEVKAVSVMKGETATLYTEAQTQSDDVIEWKFKNTLIAKMDRTAHPHPDPVLDERFKGRLHVDFVGSLIIRNIKTEDSGLYDVYITNSKHITHKRFSLTVTEFNSRSHQVKIGPGLFVVVIMLVTALVTFTGDD